MASKILLVDDDEDVRALLREILKKRNKYSISEASTGAEALALLNSCEFDLIISDIMLPQVSGAAILENLQEKQAKVPPVILISGFIDMDAQEMQERGVSAFFEKPIDERDLIASIEKLIS